MCQLYTHHRFKNQSLSNRSFQRFASHRKSAKSTPLWNFPSFSVAAKGVHLRCLHISAALRIDFARTLVAKQAATALQRDAIRRVLDMDQGLVCVDTYPLDIPILQLSILHLRAPTLSPFPRLPARVHNASACVRSRAHLSASTGESKIRLSARGLTNRRHDHTSALQEAMVFAWKLLCVRLPVFWVEIWIMHRVPLRRNIWLCMRSEKKEKKKKKTLRFFCPL